MEEGQKNLAEGLKNIEASVNKRIDDVRGLILWGFTVVFGGIGILIGFVIWDRRTALAPAIRRAEEVSQEQEKIRTALRDFAQKLPDLTESLKKANLL